LLPAGDSVPPAAVLGALDGPGDDAADLIRLLQEAQQEAGRPVTALPAKPSAGPAPTGPDPESLSDALTVAPDSSPPRLHRRAAVGALVLLVAGVLAVVVTTRPAREISTTTATTALSPVPSVTVDPPPDAPLHVADFTASRWVIAEGASSRTSVVDGQFRIHVHTPADWRGFSVWVPPPGEDRLSITVKAHMTGAGAELGILCGIADTAHKSLTAYVGFDGSWRITTNEGVVATGTAPVPPSELMEPFAMRLDCATNSRPTRAALFLNDRLLGEAEGQGPFPLDSVGIAVGTSGYLPYTGQSRSSPYGPFDLSVAGVAIRRLG
jgi:hypothetical protein